MTDPCRVIREALSARIDGEDPGLLEVVIEEHLGVCPNCRAYTAGLEAVSRRVRLEVLQQVPDLVDTIVGSSRAWLADSRQIRPTRMSRRRWGQASRWAAAALPLGVAVPALAFGVFAHPHLVPSHLPTPCTHLLLHRVHLT